MIAAKSVTKSYDGKELLTKVDFKISNGRKIGLVGKNGCGKTTLFKIISGVEEANEGNVEMQNEKIFYIPQEFSFPDELVGEYLEKLLESKYEFYKIEMIASQLNWKIDLYQDIKTLSEGQKMKLKLTEALLSDPTTLLIDEPTNHLDIEGILWFEHYVRDLRINVIMISHDRSFLNNTVDEIWEIERGKIIKFVGDYDNYREEKLRLIDKWDQEYTLFLKRKSQLEKLLENVRKIKDGIARGNAVSSAKKKIEREITNNEKVKYESKKIRDVRFETEVHNSKLMIRFENVSKRYGTKEIFNNVSFDIRGKEKIWLFGPNGAGKSTIVKMIMEEEAPSEGIITIGNNIKIGYFSQVQSGLNSKNTLQEEFIEKTGCYFGKAYGYLEKFLFDKESVQKRIDQLSPGERARFAFSIFAYNNYDLLILDEPDNHLDIETKEVIEKSLREFTGTILLVSHDRYFVESVGIDKVFNLKEGTLAYNQ